MDILLLMLLIWGYNEQPKDVKEEEPEIGPEIGPGTPAVLETSAVLSYNTQGLKHNDLS